MKKILSKSSNSNQLSTFFDLYASCGCGTCGCVCDEAWSAFQPSWNIGNVEAGYRDTMGTHT